MKFHIVLIVTFFCLFFSASKSYSQFCGNAIRKLLSEQELKELSRGSEIKAWLRDCEKRIRWKSTKHLPCRHYPNVETPPINGSTGGGVIGILPVHIGHTKRLYQLDKPVSCLLALSMSGSISSLDIHESSGDSLIDKKALNLIKETSTFKTPPGFLPYSTKVIVKFDRSIECKMLHPYKVKIRTKFYGNRWIDSENNHGVIDSNGKTVYSGENGQ